MAAAVGPHGMFGVVCSLGPLSDEPTLVAPQRSLASMLYDPFLPVHLSPRVHEVSPLVAPGGEVGCRGSSAGPPFLSSSAHRCLSVVGGGGGIIST